MTGLGPKMGLTRFMAAIGFAAALAGCASNIKQMEEARASGGTPFTQELTEEYRSLVTHEKDERDWAAADYFAIKGLAAAGGQVVLPEEVLVAGEHTQALTEARSRLVAALAGGARDGTPQAAARAQRAFDCWVHEASEDYWYDAVTDAHVAPCREEFEAAFLQLEPLKMIDDDFPFLSIVLFDLDSSNINAAGKVVIDEALAAAAKMPSAHFTVTGHTDSAGPGDYNMALSLRRADAVRHALMAGGISLDAITAAGRGESELAVPTPDGVSELANRRVEIVLQ